MVRNAILKETFKKYPLDSVYSYIPGHTVVSVGRQVLEEQHRPRRTDHGESYLHSNSKHLKLHCTSQLPTDSPFSFVSRTDSSLALLDCGVEKPFV